MEIKTSNDVKVAIMPRRFDAYTAGEVETAFAKLMEEGVSKVICDFSPTEYVASAGLRVLLSTYKRLQKSSGKLVLCCLKPYVREVFEIAGFTSLFQIYDSTDDAIVNLK
jgi:anti-sigma B factor antagonist